VSYTDVIKALSAGPLQDSLNLATVAHDSDCPMCGSPFAVTGYMPDGRLVDGVTLETGSFNYTAAAVNHNAENALVLWNVPQIAQAYAREWERLWEESK